MSAGLAAATGKSRDAHAQAQRDRILNAAQRCFTERGFHAASMAAIAETAGMSPGLIYRYFASKSELIHGIVGRQMELLADDIQRLECAAKDPISSFLDAFRERDAERDGHMLEPALVLEITAESSRDPVIAEAMQRFDARIDAALGQLLAMPREAGGFAVPREKLASRVLLMRALIDGLKSRQVREPELALDLLRDALTDALPRLMGE
ncbi:TetR/AcrR family transcriptional regulator [Luteimonas sp. e5]